MTATDAVRAFIGTRTPAALIVLGSGLGDLTDHLEAPSRLAYRDIPGFPIPTVEGHKGELVLGRLGGRDVLAQAGRFHMYEGHDAATSALCVRTAAEVRHPHRPADQRRRRHPPYVQARHPDAHRRPHQLAVPEPAGRCGAEG